MKRAPIVEDWSRFNRGVLAVADGLPRSAARQPQQPAPQQPRREPAEPVDGTDTYGLIARQKWRKHV